MFNKMNSTGAMPFLDGADGNDNPYFCMKFEPCEQDLLFHVDVKPEFMKLFAAPTKQFDQIDSLFDESFYLFMKTDFMTNFTVEDLLDGSNLIETLLKGFFMKVSG